jgi:FKBP-type peptidyl-prolyl cis-trans isomerase
MQRKWMPVAGAALIAVVAAGGIALLASRRSAAKTGSLETQKEKLSYAMGVGMAKGLKRQSIDVDVDLVARGLKDALSGENVLMTEADLREVVVAFQGEMKQKQAEAKATFLAENAKRDGVVTLPSGLQYEVLTKGDGKMPVDGDTVQCHYRGTLMDGTEFESTYRRGQSATFLVSRALPAWKEALKQMPVGSKWKLFAPSELAYGQRGLRARGAGLKVEPNAPVIFELELIAIRPPASSTTPTAVRAAPPAADLPLSKGAPE